MKGFTNKQPKIVAGSASVITRILKYVYILLWLDGVLYMQIVNYKYFMSKIIYVVDFFVFR